METRNAIGVVDYRFQRLTGLALLAWLLAFCSVATAKTINVFSSPLPVFSEKGVDGKATGYSVELARRIAKEAGYTATFFQLPFEQSQRQLHSQPFQVTTGLVRIPAREQDYHWITPINANPIRIYTRSDSVMTSNATTLQSLRSVAVLKEDYRHQLLKERYEGKIIALDSWADAITALLNDTVDGILFSEVGVNAICNRAQLDCATLRQGPVIEVFYSYIAMPKMEENTEVAERLANAAIAFKRSAGFLNLHARWLPSLSDFSANVTVAEGIVGFGFELEDVIVDDIWVITSPEPLFSQLNSQGQPEGYAVELVEQVLQRAGIKKPILAAPWERIMRESEQKSNVIAFALTRTPEREPHLHWITPITRGIHGLFGDKAFPKLNALDEIDKQTKIAVLAHDYRKDIAEEKGLNTFEFATWPEAVKALAEGEVDLLFGSDGALNYGCEKSAINCDKMHRVFDYKTTTTYLTLSKPGTRIPLVERLKAAAYETKKGAFIDNWSSDWELFLKAQPIGPVHVEKGVVNFWQRPSE